MEDASDRILRCGNSTGKCHHGDHSRGPAQAGGGRPVSVHPGSDVGPGRTHGGAGAGASEDAAAGYARDGGRSLMRLSLPWWPSPSARGLHAPDGSGAPATARRSSRRRMSAKPDTRRASRDWYRRPAGSAIRRVRHSDRLERMFLFRLPASAHGGRVPWPPVLAVPPRYVDVGPRAMSNEPGRASGDRHPIVDARVSGWLIREQARQVDAGGAVKEATRN